MSNNSPFIIGITGGSGSGKSYLCNKIVNEFGNNNILVILVDSYYKDLSHLKFEEREKNNFDHPNSIEFDLFYKHLSLLKKNKYIEMPIYNYKTHTRRSKVKKIKSNYPIILIEGILALNEKKIRDIFDKKVFIDVKNKIRMDRRLKRDTETRDRSIESIKNQYESMVIPMFKKYIEPMKKKSDIVIKKFEKNDAGYIKLMNQIKKIINDKES